MLIDLKGQLYLMAGKKKKAFELSIKFWRQKPSFPQAKLEA